MKDARFSIFLERLLDIEAGSEKIGLLNCKYHKKDPSNSMRFVCWMKLDDSRKTNCEGNIGRCELED